MFLPLILISSLLGVSADQEPLPLSNNFPIGYGTRTSNHTLANPTQVEKLALDSLSNTKFVTLNHPAHPAHQVRIKRTDGFCDPTVKSYSGYLDADHGTKHLFFYFFESRSKPEEDDVLMWINGGPGGSSAMGLFTELGPCNIDTNLTSGSNGTVYNPYGWNTNASIFFLDQPAGTGFSYDDLGRTVSTTQAAAKDVYSFLSIFFETFSDFRGRPFHISGESYGGRFIPLFASEILDQNLRTHELDADVPAINLKSVLIGNGLSEFTTLVASYYDAQCSRASLPPVTDISSCVRMKKAALRCKRELKNACVDSFDEMNCEAVFSFCAAELIQPYFDQGRNPYDMSKMCDDDGVLCYQELAYIEAFLNRKDTQAILGIDEHHSKFTTIDFKTYSAFVDSQDFHRQTQLWVAELLERGLPKFLPVMQTTPVRRTPCTDVDVLVYVGTYDFICNWIGILAWAEALEWSGKEQFNGQNLQPWIVDGKEAGLYKTSQRFTFATVQGAGHMVPFDKPAEVLAMVQGWLAKRKL